ncbi:MAG: DNA gyrase inhibitor YacG [Betaproteobacteria bacterium]|nr:DNA gyrase inhibitor YacG [Betaproteobacteria bacterium]
MMQRQVRCPQCSTLSVYRTDNPFRPFCSERCKLIDLGAWAQERYSTPGKPASGFDASTAEHLANSSGNDAELNS